MKFSKFHINLGWINLLLLLKTVKYQGSPWGALTESKVDESWSGKIENTSENLKIARY
jgi:hypothetical protein